MLSVSLYIKYTYRKMNDNEIWKRIFQIYLVSIDKRKIVVYR